MVPHAEVQEEADPVGTPPGPDATQEIIKSLFDNIGQNIDSSETQQYPDE